MKKFQLILSLVGLLTFGSAYSQCRTFVKNNCKEAMGEYVPGENFNAAKMSPGDEAEVQMTFYQGEKYRLLVCAHPVLGKLEFQVLDTEGNVLFDNTKKDLTDHFDFSVAGTQQFTIKMKVPKIENATLAPQGCVAILVGRKEKK